MRCPLPATPASPTSAPYAAYAVILVFFAGPLLWLFSLSIRTAAEVYVSEIRVWPNAPTSRTAGRVSNPLFLTYLWNGLKLAIAGAVGAMLFATPAAYALCALPLPPPQPRDDRLLAPDDLAAGHHGAALPLHGPRRPDRRHFGAIAIYIAIAAPLSPGCSKGFLDGIRKSRGRRDDRRQPAGAFMWRSCRSACRASPRPSCSTPSSAGRSSSSLHPAQQGEPQPIAVGIFNFRAPPTRPRPRSSRRQRARSSPPSSSSRPAALHHRRDDGRRREGPRNARP